MSVLIMKEIKIRGQTVKIFSRDGKNFSSDPGDLPSMETASSSEERESPFWDAPQGEAEPSYEQFD